MFQEYGYLTQRYVELYCLITRADLNHANHGHQNIITWKCNCNNGTSITPMVKSLEQYVANLQVVGLNAAHACIFRIFS